MVDPNANIIFGAVIDDRLQGEVRITVIATGFTGELQAAPQQTVANARVAQPPKQQQQQRPMSQPPAATPQTPMAEPKEKPVLDIPDFLQRRRNPPKN